MTTLTIAPEKMTEYLAGARAREAARRSAAAERRERAQAAARAAAAVLRSRFGAVRVVLFGSMVHGMPDGRSDIDLAVAGIAPEQFFRAWAAAEEVAGGFAIDLVDLATARPWVADVLARDGVEL